MKPHPFALTDAEVRDVLAGDGPLLVPVTLRNSEGGACQRALFRLNEAWADSSWFEGRLHGVLKAPVYPHPLDTPASVEGVVDRLWPRWTARGGIDERTGNRDHPGDLLWIRERHAYADEWAHFTMKEEAATVCYRTDGLVYSCEGVPFLRLDGDYCAWWASQAKRWRSAAKMPKWAARIWLRVLAVHPVRVGRRWHWSIDVELESTTGRPK